MQKWTQDEAIAYECACETITHLRAILTSEMYDESKKLNPDIDRLKELETESDRLFFERKRLGVKDYEEIQHILQEYGRRVKLWNNENKLIIG